jgi:hypothetical protein
MTDGSTSRSESTRRILAIISLQLAIVALLILLAVQYGWMHDVPHPLSPLFGDNDIESFAKGIAAFNFIGLSGDDATNEPSIFAVILEVAIWSFAGVLARQEYTLAQIVVRDREFSLLKEVSRLIGDASMGVAIAIAVVAFLRSTQFVNMTLKTADIGSIAAISFILGFYHGDTRRLLGSLQRRVAASVRDDEDEASE